MKYKRGMWTAKNEKELVRVAEDKKREGKLPDGGWDEVAEHMRAYDGCVRKTSFNRNNCFEKNKVLNPKPK